MTRHLTIEIADSVADDLDLYPLPLPSADYCERALAEALARAKERHHDKAALLAQIEATMPEPAPPHRVLLTVAQASEELQVSEKTVRRMVDDGELPTVRLLNKSLRIPWEAITELSQRRGPRSARSSGG